MRFELAVEQGGCWSPWTASATLGPHRFPSLATQHGSLRSEVDVFFASEPAERVRMRLALHSDEVRLLDTVPWLATLSASDLAQVPDSDDVAGGRAVIDVPACSQMEEPESLRHRICSPTSVAMVLGRWGVHAAPRVLAADVFDAQLDLYGVWPAAIRAGARRGIGGYLLRFPDWQAARWCLGAGLPVVASVRYARGELSGAAIEETSGHLIVLTGFDGAEVLVNDPAAPTRAEVPRRYTLDQLRRVWLERSGVGYVFFRP
ncbi:MAG: C39 family peptidase [Candidatus Rokubacteria bacterium]|nr:C39 family peptidase [Candidatus Rokubacteria bacterium]